MIHSLQRSDRVEVHWPFPSRSLERLGHIGMAVLRWALRFTGLVYEMPDVRMSDDWLAEHERQSGKHPHDV